MKPQPQHSESETIEAARILDDSPFLNFITDHGRTIIIAILSALLIFVLLYRLTSGSSANAEKDFARVENDYTHLKSLTGQGNSAAAQDDLKQLQEIFARHPELNQKYDSLVAQVLIFQNLSAEAQPFAEQSLARVKANESPLFYDYSENTLTIVNKDYAKALTSAIALKEKLIPQLRENKPSIDTLHVMNLLRIAMLNQQLGNKKEELAAWDALQMYAKNVKSSDLALLSLGELNQHFAEGKVTLFDYIDYRKKALSK